MFLICEKGAIKVINKNMFSMSIEPECLDF